MKVAKMNYHGIKDVIIVPQVLAYVDRSTKVKRDIHIRHTEFGCYGWGITFCCFDYCCTGILRVCNFHPEYIGSS